MTNDLEPDQGELDQLRNQISELGVKFRSLSDSQISQASRYPEIVEIAQSHLGQNYSDWARSVIASLLLDGKKTGKIDWYLLLHYYEEAPERIRVESDGTVKNTLGMTKTILANVLLRSYSNDNFLALSKALRDSRNGPTRAILVNALRRRKRTAEIAALLEDLRQDSKLSVEINSWATRISD